MHKKKILSIILAMVLLLLSFAGSVLAQSDEELEQQKKAATKAKEAAQYQVDMTQNTIEGIEAEIAKADTEIGKIEDEISGLKSEIESLNNQKGEAEVKLKESESKLAEQEEYMKKRIKAMYMFGNDGYLQVLFSSSGFSDLLAKVDMVKAVIKADRVTADAYEATIQEVNVRKEEIETATVKTKEAKESQEVSLAAQANIRKQKDELLAKNEEILVAHQSEVNEQQAIFDAADNELLARAEAREAEAARIRAEKEAEATASQGGSGGSGSESSGGSPAPAPAPSNGLIWPISSQYHPRYWDDWFGDRVSPGGIGSSYHLGVDMAADYGTPVWAAANGVVTHAGWNGGYGNCVMISTNYGTVLYGHLSSIYVSEGQYVTQGQTVGGVGSTGNSTGDHLHLGLMINGGFVDPMGYMHW